MNKVIFHWCVHDFLDFHTRGQWERCIIAFWMYAAILLSEQSDWIVHLKNWVSTFWIIEIVHLGKFRYRLFANSWMRRSTTSTPIKWTWNIVFGNNWAAGCGYIHSRDTALIMVSNRKRAYFPKCPKLFLLTEILLVRMLEE